MLKDLNMLSLYDKIKVGGEDFNGASIQMSHHSRVDGLHLYITAYCCIRILKVNIKIQVKSKNVTINDFNNKNYNYSLTKLKQQQNLFYQSKMFFNNTYFKVS